MAEVTFDRPGVVDFGGTGQAIVLLHGLMGRASTWRPVADWLTRYGRVVGLDARGHGASPHRGGGWRTEDFAADAAEVIERLGPAVVIGHSMGGLHAWMLAAARPELVRAVVVEDMAPDQRGRTVDPWRSYFESWPVPFGSLAHVREFFGSLGDYFVECVERRADGYHLVADLEDLYGIAGEWGERDFWPFVERVRCPLLAIEPEHSAMPAGQLARMPVRAPGGGHHLVVAGAGHVVHRDVPLTYRGAVEAFLSEVLNR
ncbi:alpha/beta fold hydrolase [Actinophytocola sediminis]